MKRRTLLTTLAGVAIALAGGIPATAQEKVLRVAMTIADIPQTTGQPNQGGEGTRFIGLTLYDGLINWDLSQYGQAAKLRPGLAESWQVSEADTRIWNFTLRRDVVFHDGKPFNADAVVWNLDKLMKRDAPQFDQAQAGQASQYFATIASYRKIDDRTVEITTKEPDAVFPYLVAGIYYSSPSRWEEVGRDWAKFAVRPAGTGPFILDKLQPRERAELVRNARYWDKERIPKSDRLILIPMPDANTRIAALLSGQVDWVEAPPPDTIPRLKQQGMQVVTNVYPHVWPYQLSFLPDSPFKDLRIRKAANLAIDREGMVKFLGGLAAPAKGMVTPTHPWFGKPTFDLKYDPNEAIRLLAEAGYGPKKPVKAKFIISTAGSGQMQPLPMNEFVKENLREVGIEVEFDVLEWEALRSRRRAGADAAENKGAHAVNNSWAFWDPDIGLVGTSASFMRPPAGYNWGDYRDPKADELARQAKNAFDPAAQDKILAELHQYIVDQAMWIWVVHDLNPRAMSPKVKGFVQAQSWFQDLTTVVVQ